MPNIATIKLPPKLLPVFAATRGALRYRGAYGGRGSGKSFSFALMAAVWGYAEKMRILCTRELQVSIKESFHAEVKNAIASVPFLAEHYDVGIDYIRGANGTEFIFRGLRHNMSSIKSMAQIDLCIVEEAEDIPETAWLDLEPTIRSERSEIWVIWNPRQKDSPVDKRFRQSVPPRSAIVEMNHADNPKFPMVLEEQRKHQQRTLDDATYRHIWDGAYLEHSDAQIFNGKYVVEEFEPDAEKWHGPYYGLDFGFAQDPTAGVKCWVHDNNLYIEYEAGQVGLELDYTSEFMRECVPGIEREVVWADSARPESISYLKRHGLPRCTGVTKGKGSVEDGIEHIKSYTRVIIHPRCKETLNEFRMYSYKVDKLTKQVLSVVVDACNHYVDAIRYALSPMITGRLRMKITQAAIDKAMGKR